MRVWFQIWVNVIIIVTLMVYIISHKFQEIPGWGYLIAAGVMITIMLLMYKVPATTPFIGTICSAWAPAGFIGMPETQEWLEQQISDASIRQPLALMLNIGVFLLCMLIQMHIWDYADRADFSDSITF